MSKFGLQIDTNYRRGAERKDGIREALRRNLHPPEKRATTNTLFLIGLLTLAIIGGGMLGLRH